MQKIIVSDASTLILIEKISLLDILIERYSFVISKEIYDEAVIKGKKKNAEDAYSLEEKADNNLILVKTVRNTKKIKEIIDEFGIAKGETESIVLYMQEDADLLATDDHKAINVCKIYKIPFMTALTFVVMAFRNKLIIKKQAIEMTQQLGKYGRYKSEIILNSMKYLEVTK